MDFLGVIRDVAIGAARLTPGISTLVDGLETARDTYETMETIKSLGEYSDLLLNAGSVSSELVSVATMLLKPAQRTEIIAAGLQSIIGMHTLCGWTNEPTKGESYGEGGAGFNEVHETLSSATPDEGWTGRGSDAYADANTRQRELIRKMVDADYAVSGALSAEANRLNETQRILNNMSTALGNAILPALLAEASGGRKYGERLKLAVEAAAVSATIPTCLYRMNEMSEFADERAKTISEAVSIYREIARDGYPTWM